MSEESSNLKAFICHHEYKMARALGLSYAYKQKKETIQMVSTTGTELKFKHKMKRRLERYLFEMSTF
jgi:hypothetical protein